MPSLKEAQRRHSQYYLQKLWALNGEQQEQNRELIAEQFEQDWKQTQQGQAWAAANAERENAAATLCVFYPIISQNIVDLYRGARIRASWLASAVKTTQRFKHIETEIESPKTIGDLVEVIRQRVNNALSDLPGLPSDLRNTIVGVLVGIGAQRDRFLAAMSDHDGVVRATKVHMLGRLAAACEDLELHQQALEYLQLALTLSQQAENQHLITESLNNLGTLYRRLGQFAQAIECYEKALPIVRQLDTHVEEMLNNLGVIYASMKQPQQALEYYQEALEIARNKHNKKAEGNCLNNLGDLYISLKQPAHALENCQQSLTIARELGEKRQEANSLGGMGLAYMWLEQFDQATTCLQQARALFESLEIQSDIQKTDQNIGLVQAMQLFFKSETLSQQGDHEQAIDLLQEARTIVIKIGKQGLVPQIDQLIAQARNGQIIQIHSKQSRPPDEAASKEPYREIQNFPPGIEERWINLSSLGEANYQLLVTGQFDEAAENFEHILKQSQQLPIIGNEIAIYGLRGMGILFTEVKEFDKALPYFEKANFLARRMDRIDKQFIVFCDMGNLYREKGDYAKALSSFETALSYAQMMMDLKSVEKIQEFITEIKFRQSLTPEPSVSARPSPAQLSAAVQPQNKPSEGKRRKWRWPWQRK